MSVRRARPALALVVALAAVACQPSEELCDRQKGIAEGLEIIEAYYSFCLERARAGTLDGDTLIQAKDAMLSELRANPEVSAYIQRRKQETKLSWSEGNLVNSRPDHAVLLFAEGDANEIASELTHSETRCQPGIVYDKNGKVVEDPCAKRVPVTVPDPGHEDAIALARDLGDLQKYTHLSLAYNTDQVGVLEEILGIFDRIESNRLTSYLTTTCDFSDVFSSLSAPAGGDARVSQRAEGAAGACPAKGALRGARESARAAI